MSAIPAPPGTVRPQQKKKVFQIRPDPYTKLLNPSSKERLTACLDLIHDIANNEQRDAEEAAKKNEVVKLNADGLTVHLEYCLGRLIAGMESTEDFAAIGFGSALSMVLVNFEDRIPNSVLESMIKKRHGNATGHGPLTTSEEQHFDLGASMLIQVLQKTNRLPTTSAEMISHLLKSVVRLCRRSPQMYDFSVDTLVSLSEDCYRTSSQHYNVILDALKAFIPTTAKGKFADAVNQLEDPLLAQWRPATLSAALCLRRLGQSDFYEKSNGKFVGLLVQPNTWKSMFDIIYPSIQHYPVVPTVWRHILVDLLTIPGAFAEFWEAIVVQSLLQHFVYHKKSLALDLILIVLDLINDNKRRGTQQDFFTPTLVQALLTTMFTPEVVKLVMQQARAVDTPLYGKVMQLLETVEQTCQYYNTAIPTMIGIFTTPARGGSRLFDTKSGTRFTHTLIQYLQPQDLIAYIQQTVENFYIVEDIVTADIRHIAELSKKRDDEVNAMKDQEDKQQEEEEKEETTTTTTKAFDRITDVDAFMSSDIAKKEINTAMLALQKWSIDHIYHMCDILLKLQQQVVDDVEKDEKKAAEDTTTTTKKVVVKADQQQVEECLKTCVSFLFTHAFFKPLKAAKTAKQNKLIIAELNADLQDYCQQRYISLYSLLLQNSGVSTRKTTDKVLRWPLFLFDLDTQLRTTYKATNVGTQSDVEAFSTAFDAAKNTLTFLTKFLTEIEKARENFPDVAEIYAELAQTMKYLVLSSFALVYTDARVIVSLIEDYLPIVERIQKEFQDKTKKTAASAKRKAAAVAMDDEDHPWADVVMDILLALLGLGHNIIRKVVLKVLGVIATRITMSALHDLINTLVQPIEEGGNEEDQQQKMGEESGEDSDLDGLLDFDEDDESELDDDDIDIGGIVRKFNNIGKDKQEDGDDEDDEEEEEKENNGEVKMDDDEDEDDDSNDLYLDAHGASDLLLDMPNDYIPKAEQDAINTIIKLNKQKTKMHKNKLKEEMLMKLRILDLIDLLIDELPLTNTWLSLLMPVAVLITSTRNTTLAPLHQRATLLFKNKLCNMKNSPVTQQLQSVVNSNNADKTIAEFIEVYDDVEKAKLTFDILPQDKCNGDSIKAILEAIFESIAQKSDEEKKREQEEEAAKNKGKKAKNQPTEESTTQKSTVASYALIAAGTAYLTAPAGIEEQSNAVGPKKRGAKKLAKEEIQFKIYQQRVVYFIQQFTPLLELYLSTKKDTFAQSFFTTLCNTPALVGYMWGSNGVEGGDENAKVVVNILQNAMDTAATPYLRTQATTLLTAILNHYRYAFILQKPEHVLTILKSTYTKAAALLAAVKDAAVAQQQQQQQQKQQKPAAAATKNDKKAQKEQQKLQQEKNRNKAMKVNYQKVVERTKSIITTLEQRMRFDVEKMTFPLTKKQLQEYQKVKAKAAATVDNKKTTKKTVDEEQQEEKPVVATKATPKKSAKAAANTMNDDEEQQQQPEAEEAPAAKTKATPRKSAKAKTAEVVVEEEAVPEPAPEEETIPEPKKRGRKPKAVVEEEQPQQEEEKKEEEAVVVEEPKKRGRKPKTPVVEEEEEKKEEEEAVVVEEPKKRGRKPKTPVVEEEEEKKEEEEAVEEVVQPKKRGRPAKAAVTPVQEEENDTAVNPKKRKQPASKQEQDKVEEDVQEEEVVPPPRRSARRKEATPPQEEQEEAPRRSTRRK